LKRARSSARPPRRRHRADAHATTSPCGAGVSAHLRLEVRLSGWTTAGRRDTNLESTKSEDLLPLASWTSPPAVRAVGSQIDARDLHPIGALTAGRRLVGPRCVSTGTRSSICGCHVVPPLNIRELSSDTKCCGRVLISVDYEADTNSQNGPGIREQE
jgi:hypothetical protein